MAGMYTHVHACFMDELGENSCMQQIIKHANIYFMHEQDLRAVCISNFAIDYDSATKVSRKIYLDWIISTV